MAANQEWYSDVPRSCRGATMLGCLAVIVSIGGFGYWSSIAPLAGAVIANGVFVAPGQNKVVQHLEGGVIREILVDEGSVVAEGQPLITLDETGPSSELRRLLLRQARLQAMSARLRTEVGHKEKLTMPERLEVLAAADPEVSGLVSARKITFVARQKSIQSEVDGLRDSIASLEQRVTGGKVQLSAVRSQLGLIHEELAAKESLLKTGLIRKSEVLALQRAKANLEGEIGRIQGEIGDAQERIARANEQIAGVRYTAAKSAVEQMHEVEAELNDVGERIRAAQRTLERVQIVAPVRGTVVKLRYRTPGGVIEAGKSVLEIVPAHDESIIEARVRPQDITHVRSGQKATVRLTALRARVTPMVSGEVIYLSADAILDEKRSLIGPADFYVVRVKLDLEETRAVPDFHATPGMPAEVYITTSERTFIEYLLQPIKDSMSRAFREH
ncbi:MAG TPA: HlyD family type I secretion periplasmic adaptor subunit [Beijerinckiaceae bacterium]